MSATTIPAVTPAVARVLRPATSPATSPATTSPGGAESTTAVVSTGSFPTGGCLPDSFSAAATQPALVPGVRLLQDLPLFVEHVRGCHLDQEELRRSISGSALAVVERGDGGSLVVGLLVADEAHGLLVRCVHVSDAVALRHLLVQSGVSSAVVDARTRGEASAIAAGVRVISREQLEAWEAWSGGPVRRLEAPERAQVFRSVTPSTSRLRSRAACVLLRGDVIALLRLTLEGGGTTH